MHANLMCAPGLQIDRDICRLAETFHNIPVGNGRAPVRHYSEPEIGNRVTADRSVNSSFILLKAALGYRIIDLGYFMLGKLPAHFPICQLGLAYQHQPAGACIQS